MATTATLPQRDPLHFHSDSNGMTSDVEEPPVTAVRGTRPPTRGDMSDGLRAEGGEADEGKQGKSRIPKLEDFELIRVVGKGCAGRVLLVRHTPSTSILAMKAISKRSVFTHDELPHTLAELSILKRFATSEPSNPFIARLHSAFTDKENFYFVMEFYPGGDLATQMEIHGILGHHRTRFYAADIVQGLEDLHRHGIVVRDLKPENILLNAKGHAVLADFGLSKEFGYRGEPKAVHVVSYPGEGDAPTWAGQGAGSIRTMPNGTKRLVVDRAYSFVGTSEYLAPEVVKRGDYSYAVDWWALGCIILEGLIGRVPFRKEDDEPPIVLWNKILLDPWDAVFSEPTYARRSMSDYGLDPTTYHLIDSLLQKDPMWRLTEPNVKSHAYFVFIDWPTVQRGEYEDPHGLALHPTAEYNTQYFPKLCLEEVPTVDMTSHESRYADDRQPLTPLNDNSLYALEQARFRKELEGFAWSADMDDGLEDDDEVRDREEEYAAGAQDVEQGLDEEVEGQVEVEVESGVAVGPESETEAAGDEEDADISSVSAQEDELAGGGSADHEVEIAEDTLMTAHGVERIIETPELETAAAELAETDERLQAQGEKGEIAAAIANQVQETPAPTNGEETSLEAVSPIPSAVPTRIGSPKPSHRSVGVAGRPSSVASDPATSPARSMRPLSSVMIPLSPPASPTKSPRSVITPPIQGLVASPLSPPASVSSTRPVPISKPPPRPPFRRGERSHDLFLSDSLPSSGLSTSDIVSIPSPTGEPNRLVRRGQGHRQMASIDTIGVPRLSVEMNGHITQLEDEDWEELDTSDAIESAPNGGGGSGGAPSAFLSRVLLRRRPSQLTTSGLRRQARNSDSSRDSSVSPTKPKAASHAGGPLFAAKSIENTKKAFERIKFPKFKRTDRERVVTPFVIAPSSPSLPAAATVNGSVSSRESGGTGAGTGGSPARPGNERRHTESGWPFDKRPRLRKLSSRQGSASRQGQEGGGTPRSVSGGGGGTIGRGQGRGQGGMKGSESVPSLGHPGVGSADQAPKLELTRTPPVVWELDWGGRE